MLRGVLVLHSAGTERTRFVDCWDPDLSEDLDAGPGAEIDYVDCSGTRLVDFDSVALDPGFGADLDRVAIRCWNSPGFGMTVDFEGHLVDERFAIDAKALN